MMRRFPAIRVLADRRPVRARILVLGSYRHIPLPLAPDLTGNIVRELGLVDIKVSAVEQDWSGLKFVSRVADNTRAAFRLNSYL